MKYYEKIEIPLLIITIIMALEASPTGHPSTPNETPGVRSQYSGKMYFAIAATSSGQIYSRAFNKTLANITQSYLTGKSNVVTYNISLETLVIELPETGSFSSKFLQNVCERFEDKHVVAVLVVGNSRAAFTVALAAGHAGVPVLWARGTNSFLPGFNNLELSPFEVYLEPTSRELMEALRALFIQTHWHSFTILADDSVISSVLLRRELVAILEAPPLNPTLVQLPALHQPQALFRRLADVSRSTRGVVILMCDRPAAGRVLDEARRLNMVDSHFVWLWIDTEPLNFTTTQPSTDKPSDNKRDKRDSLLNRTVVAKVNLSKRLFIRDKRAAIRLRDSSVNQVLITEEKLPDFKVKTPLLYRNKRDAVQFLETHRTFIKSDLSEMHVNYLVKNDQFLLFNRQPIVDTTKYRESVISAVKKKTWTKYDRKRKDSWPELPAGLLSIRALPMKVDRHLVKGAVRLLVGTLRTVLARCPDWLAQSIALEDLKTSCWTPVSASEFNFSSVFSRELKTQCSDALAGKKLLQENGAEKVDKSLVSNFEISNLVPDTGSKDSDTEVPETSGQGQKLKWRTVGHVTGRTVHLDTIVWPGGGIVVAGLSSQARSVFRVVTALAPPFVMESGLDEDGQCLRGLPCHRVLTSDKDNLTLVFNEMDTQERMGDETEEGTFQNDHKHENSENDKILPFQRYKFKTNCCYGLAMDLLENIAHELEFDFRLYIVADGVFGTKVSGVQKKIVKRDVGKAYLNYKFKQDGIFKGERKPGAPSEAEDDDLGNDAKWNGIVGDLVSGAAHMSFAALSVSSPRSEVIDFSAPFFFSGVSFLAAPQQKSEIPLMAFLLPFSPELWIAIFTSLNITAIAVAVYEWLSPFGLNPWGRQRSKNFSMSSALWVMWGLLCGHLVAFKAPKSWPNKFLINVWGGFSVIFVASYTANIAALIAGLFFQNTVSNYHDRSLLSQKVGAPRASAAEYYVKRASKLLWDHMNRYTLDNVEDGIERLRNGSLDILIADTPILDYYRATDHGCTLQKIGDSINEDTYAVGMNKGFPLKETNPLDIFQDSISAVISKYASNGYMDILQEKWYGGLPCFKLVTEIAQPRPLGVTAVTGVFILLGVGVILGVLILIFEHLFYRYTLPILRHKPKGTIWRSRNIMFFSQKLYRFINCVELVSPHHAARELVHTLRQGQITSLFQKSVKRKEHEQRRRRKSKAQFFEMIQEIRRQQQESRQQQPLASLTEVDQEYQLSPDDKRGKLSPNIIRRTFMRSSPKLEAHPKIKSPPNIFSSSLFSPRSKTRARSQTALNVRRFSTDSVFNSQTLKIDRSSAIGRRLSKDAGFLSSSPPDINSRRSSYLDIINSSGKLSGKSPVLSIENVSECESIGRRPSDFKRKISDAESIGRKLATLPKYKDSLNSNRLHPGDRFNQGQSEEALSKPESNSPNYGTLQVNDILTAQSFQSSPNSSKHEIEVPPKKNKTEDEIVKRNKITIDELKIQLKKTDSGKPPVTRSQSNATNPSIRIQVEDTSKPKLPDRKLKSRHRSLGEAPESPLPPEPTKRVKVVDQSKSFDENPVLPVREASRNKSKNKGYETDYSLDVKETSKNRNHGRDYDSDQCKSDKPKLPPKDGLRMKLRSREESERPQIPSKAHLRNKLLNKDYESNKVIEPLGKEASERQQLLGKKPRVTEKHISTSRSVEEHRQPGKINSRSVDEHIPGTDTSRLLGKNTFRSSELPGKDTTRSKTKSKSFESNTVLPMKEVNRSGPPKCREHDLPPAPPPPNCSPRNSNGQSPLERLSKDELVNLWRSSESELRSHLLKAIRDKDSDDPP